MVFGVKCRCKDAGTSLIIERYVYIRRALYGLILKMQTESEDLFCKIQAVSMLLCVGMIAVLFTGCSRGNNPNAGRSTPSVSPADIPLTAPAGAAVHIIGAAAATLKNAVITSGAFVFTYVDFAGDSSLFYGTSDTAFSPDSAGMPAVILYRCAGSPAPPNLVLDFVDAGKAGGYALDAFAGQRTWV